MGYGCPPPLAGGGVAPSNADTRVITALLTTATEGGKWRRDEGREVCVCVGGGGGCFIHTPALPSLPPPYTLSCVVTGVMKAVRAVMIGHRGMDGQI